MRRASPWAAAALLLAVLGLAPHSAAMRGAAGVPTDPERLRRAAEMGDLETVKRLVLKEKVDPNAAPMFGETPLHWSSQSGHLPVVEELIGLGADVRRPLPPAPCPPPLFLPPPH